ncbi:MAG TPA: sensor domain-containing diguanylate cyclase [Gammaproteobacteria bacterium]|nr:sensor domain-containing diguanylate cyclase [Gammaproteobacteria bacterium]
MTVTGSPPRDHQDEPATGNDTDASAARLIRQVDRYIRLLQINNDAIVCADEDCRIVVFNQGAERLFGYPSDEIVGQPLVTLVCPRYQAAEKHRLAALTRIARESRMGFRIDRVLGRRKNSERFPVEVSVSQTEISSHRLYTIIIHDATDRITREQHLTYQAKHDELTDLPNRNLLNERLSAGIARADRDHRKLGVVFLDLDRFKPINDRYGHETGDCLLQAIARRLADTMRQSDTVSRVGGDEFIICLEQIKSEQDAVAAARKIADAMKQPFQILGQNIDASASIGIAVYPEHGRDPVTLLRHADQAMYSAKADRDSLQVYRPRAGD